MSLQVAAEQICTLLIILFIGFIIKRLNIITDELNKKLSIILLYITSPALIFSSFIKEYDPQKMITIGYIALGTFCSFFVFILLAETVFFFFLKASEAKTVLKASAVFSNCGYMGFPLIGSVFGQDGVFYASIYVVIFHLMVWTYGVIIYSGERDLKNLKRALLSPALIAVAIGLPVYIFQIKIPVPIVNSSKLVGEMTTPLAMIIIGAIMANTKLKELIMGWKVYYASFIRLVVVPVIAIICLRLISFPAEAAQIIIITLAMPVAVNVAIFAERYDKDPILASKIVTISTILSILTIPVVFLFC